MNETHNTNQSPSTFSRSIDLLLSAVMKQSGACRACLYQVQEVGRGLALLGNVLKTEGANDADRLNDCLEQDWHSKHQPFYLSDVLFLPLRHQSVPIGVAVFEKHADRSWSALDQRFLSVAGEAIGRVLARLRAAARTMELASEVDRLQAELSDRKISERLEGLWSDQASPDSAAIAGADHVTRVLETENLQSYLVQERSRLQEELRDRRILATAKQALAQTRGLTEEQAYLLLRNESRRSRRKLRTVALEVIRDLQRPAA